MLPRINRLYKVRLFSTSVSNKSIKTQLKFFSKPDCQLCHEAKNVLDNAINDIPSKMKKEIGDIEIIDITAKGNENWFNCYRYDIPVLHVEREGYKKVVFMHRFDHEELVEELGQDM